MNTDPSGTGDDRSTSDSPPRIGSRFGTALRLGALGLATYLAALLVHLPAEFVARRAALPPQVSDISGTVWAGRALVEGGYELRWSVSPLASIATFGLAADWTLEGRDTRLAGEALARPNGVTLKAVDGRAGWGLARLAAPALTVDCDGSAAVTLSRVVLRPDLVGAEGEVRTGPAVCVDSSRAPPEAVDVPPLVARASIADGGSTIVASTVADPATILAEVAVRDRVFAATVHPAGAALAGSPPVSGPITLEYPF